MNATEKQQGRICYELRVAEEEYNPEMMKFIEHQLDSYGASAVISLFAQNMPDKAVELLHDLYLKYGEQ